MKFKHFVLLNAADVVTTYTTLSYLVINNPSLKELNPMYAYLFKEYGLLLSLIAVKVIGLCILYCLYKIMPHMSNLKLYKINYNFNPKTISINVLCFMLLFVVLNNMYWIIKNVAF